MKYIVMFFHMEDDVYNEIMNQDKHGNDLLDEVNDMAREDFPEDVWHFTEDPHSKIDEIWDTLELGHSVLDIYPQISEER